MNSYAFSVFNASHIRLRISAKYDIIIDLLQIKVFIYNKTQFDSLYVNLQHQVITFANLPFGLGSQVVDIFTANYMPPSTYILFGICGF